MGLCWRNKVLLGLFHRKEKRGPWLGAHPGLLTAGAPCSSLSRGDRKVKPGEAQPSTHLQQVTLLLALCLLTDFCSGDHSPAVKDGVDTTSNEKKEAKGAHSDLGLSRSSG